MSAPHLRRAFMVLHAALGLGVLAHAAQALFHAMEEHGGPDVHLGLVIGLQAIAAVLFLIPRTLRPGAIALLVVLVGGFAVHLTRGEFEPHSLVFAAAVWYVMAHGAAWGAPSPSGSGPA